MKEETRETLLLCLDLKGWEKEFLWETAIALELY